MTAINLVNLAALLCALLFTLRNIAWLGLGFAHQMFGGALFVISFPTFYYAAIGYVDPALICFLTLGVPGFMTLFALRWWIRIRSGSAHAEASILLAGVAGAEAAARYDATGPGSDIIRANDQAREMSIFSNRDSTGMHLTCSSPKSWISTAASGK